MSGLHLGTKRPYVMVISHESGSRLNSMSLDDNGTMVWWEVVAEIVGLRAVSSFTPSGFRPESRQNLASWGHSQTGTTEEVALRADKSWVMGDLGTTGFTLVRTTWDHRLQTVHTLT